VLGFQWAKGQILCNLDLLFSREFYPIMNWASTYQVTVVGQRKHFSFIVGRKQQAPIAVRTMT
jgi:hypothetical protein